MKQETEFIVKCRLHEVASTATISEQILVSGKGIFSSFIKVGLEELQCNCSSRKRVPGLASTASPGEDFHSSHLTLQSDRGCTQLVHVYKGLFSFKRSDASQIRIFSDVNFCPLAYLDRKLFKPKPTFGPPVTSLPVCSSG